MTSATIFEFRLDVASEGAFAGWDISYHPKDVSPPDGSIEFSAIATPPYHNFDERYIETTLQFYGPGNPGDVSAPLQFRSLR